ncbi:precorrin-3B synthase [Aquamicrobium sp. LC103]|uniref:precorrin-3B synthase n=1 Tax=Aquamicrobium sp. LC103 TaxID=1120658 RepID=UPI00063E840E|nr:precorrin-3B synthase [Aquamicrobium sp. LC103]TKT76698.1 precorrin-3B synthase [Aquamicrobium sp. LC103]
MISSPLARGACPSLSAPMLTGDGLLVRLNPLEPGFLPHILAGIAEAAARHGNGIVEITSRGSLQVRGLTEKSAVLLAGDVAALGIRPRTGVPVETSPLAELDPKENPATAELAANIRSLVSTGGLSARLGPKVSVIVDGNGSLTLDGLAADIRLLALDRSADRWLLATGGDGRTCRPVGVMNSADAPHAVKTLLERIAARGKSARGRDLGDADIAALARGPRPAPAPAEIPIKASPVPIGRFALSNGNAALGLGLEFGQTEAADLIGLCDRASRLGASEIRLAPAHAILMLGIAEERLDEMGEMAARLGMIVEPGDPRLSIAACPGAPACHAGHFAARKIAAGIADAHGAMLDGSFRLHVSGCEKRCARPSGPTLTIVGAAAGARFEVSAAAQARTLARADERGIAPAFARIAQACRDGRKTSETFADVLARLEPLRDDEEFGQPR